MRIQCITERTIKSGCILSCISLCSDDNNGSDNDESDDDDNNNKDGSYDDEYHDGDISEAFRI